MKRTELYHPRVFDSLWAEKYYNNNFKNIQRAGKDIVKILKQYGFKNGKILDAGCGFGAIDIEIAKAFPEAEIIAVDLSEPLLEIAKRDAEKNKVSDRITFQPGDVHNLSFDTASFDLVINTFLLHIVEHPIDMLNELDRVTKPNGHIIVLDLCRNWLAWIIKELRKSLTLNEASEIIKKSNIRKGKTSRGAYWWAWESDN